MLSTPLALSARQPKILLSCTARKPTSRWIRACGHKRARLETGNMFDIAHILKSSLSGNRCCQRDEDEEDAIPSEAGFLWIERRRNKSSNLQNKDSA
jgi:hypothetical protein